MSSSFHQVSVWRTLRTDCQPANLGYCGPMQPFVLNAKRLLLDQPRLADVPQLVAHCRDPLFVRFLTTPWPYEPEHAEWFILEYVAGGWARNEEWTWAIRAAEGSPLMGVVSVRIGNGNVGYWLGAPHRGNGFMVEALTVVIDSVFELTGLTAVTWACVVGNDASASVARGAGFAFTGLDPGRNVGRPGATQGAWTAELRREDDRSPKPGWPV